MIYYDLINEKDGIDYERMKTVKTTKDISKQCQSCKFYYFITGNFRKSRYDCDRCFLCKLYEQNNKGLLVFRITKTEKGHFRTVSSCFLRNVEKELQKHDLKKYGWIFF